jgi:hypothetical protein
MINRDKTNPLTKHELVKWMTKVIRPVWQHELEQWKARNEAVHGTTKEEKYHKVRERLLEDAAELYTHKFDILEPDCSKIFQNWHKVTKKKN